MNKLPDLSQFKDSDLLSLSMFTLFKLQPIPEYTLLSELPYLLGREELLNLCTYYGGKTIKIPTLQELDDTIKLLLIYQLHILGGKGWKESLHELGYENSQYRAISKQFKEFMTLLESYNISVRELYE